MRGRRKRGEMENCVAVMGVPECGRLVIRKEFAGWLVERRDFGS